MQSENSNQPPSAVHNKKGNNALYDKLKININKLKMNMKKDMNTMDFCKKAVLAVLFAVVLGGVAWSQGVYWVAFRDKAECGFDPYGYFDAKAIDRYKACGADLWDSSNWPLTAGYVEAVADVAEEVIGESRWLNAVGVAASEAAIEEIRALPFVKEVRKIGGDMETASRKTEETEVASGQNSVVSNQLLRMKGDLFSENGIDGSGVRIAVLDGGFPKVDRHPAFYHLHRNKRIVETYNFCNKKTNVYGWNSHGTMTLSCITGIYEGQQLGLATGAEFLLYRTEVESEPFKEEIWWAQAMERADKMGADIISSSLGYGKERYYPTQMDGTSYVAKAATMAARKGILVCNSAGNEADDKRWKTIITPADADSVLCVAGIEPSLTNYAHVDFSSYGPTADGRRKPNVCAFGYADVANPSGGLTNVAGTSFSCPLVAGFAACVLQLSRGIGMELSAMDLFQVIEESGDLYPYYDYAFGYGVPQASYFIGGSDTVEPPYGLYEVDTLMLIIAKRHIDKGTLFYKIHNLANGTIEEYSTVALKDVDSSDIILYFDKRTLVGRAVCASLMGYYRDYTLTDEEFENYVRQAYISDKAEYATALGDGQHKVTLHNDASTLKTRQWGTNSKNQGDIYFLLGDAIHTRSDELGLLAWSPALRGGARLVHSFGKTYSLGIGIELGGTFFNFHTYEPNPYDPKDESSNIAKPFATSTLDKKCLRLGEFSMEFFQRVRLLPGGLVGKGLHWDLSIYGSVTFANYRQYWSDGDGKNTITAIYRHGFQIPNGCWNWGLQTRLTYDFIGVYARYCMTGVLSKEAAPALPYKTTLPRLEVGIQLLF